jgi:acetoacetate decarboxylase
MTIRYAGRSLDASGPSAAAPAEQPKLWSQTLVTFYETDPELIRSVLPKPLEMSDTPLVRLNVAQVEMPSGPLGASVVSVTCTHDGLEGFYDLTMVMTTEQAVVGGRETFGEPKKLGDVRLTRDGDRIHGTVTRMGVTYLEVEGTVAEQLDLQPVNDRTTFYFKFLMDPQGKGFDHDPSLVHCTRSEEQRLRERIDATVTLRDSDFDPVADLPVRRITSCTYAESNTTQRGEIVGTVPQEWLLPFAHQRYDHLATLKLQRGDVDAPGL